MPAAPPASPMSPEIARRPCPWRRAMDVAKDQRGLHPRCAANSSIRVARLLGGWMLDLGDYGVRIPVGPHQNSKALAMLEVSGEILKVAWSRV